MSGWLRRAGRGRLPDGTGIVWSVAEGSRGRRWREVRTLADGSVASSLLLEVDPDGRFSHTELSTAAGLLTLHPEGDGTLHGNVITAGGVEHVRGLPWSADDVLLLEGSAVCAAVASRRRPRGAFVVALDLSWRITASRDSGPTVAVDERGIPILDDAEEWPLEEA